MTKQEIKDLIAAKIAGQGNQVDSGGALAAILNAIVDNSGGGNMFVLESHRDYHEIAGHYNTKEALLQALGVNSEDWDKFMSADFAVIKFYTTYEVGDEETNAIDVFSVVSWEVYNGDKGTSGFNMLLGTLVASETGAVIAIDGNIENGVESYSITLYEV